MWVWPDLVVTGALPSVHLGALGPNPGSGVGTSGRPPSTLFTVGGSSKAVLAKHMKRALLVPSVVRIDTATGTFVQPQAGQGVNTRADPPQPLQAGQGMTTPTRPGSEGQRAGGPSVVEQTGPGSDEHAHGTTLGHITQGQDEHMSAGRGFHAGRTREKPGAGEERVGNDGKTRGRFPLENSVVGQGRSDSLVGQSDVSGHTARRRDGNKTGASTVPFVVAGRNALRSGVTDKIRLDGEETTGHVDSNGHQNHVQKAQPVKDLGNLQHDEMGTKNTGHALAGDDTPTANTGIHQTTKPDAAENNAHKTILTNDGAGNADLVNNGAHTLTPDRNDNNHKAAATKDAQNITPAKGGAHDAAPAKKYT